MKKSQNDKIQPDAQKEETSSETQDQEKAAEVKDDKKKSSSKKTTRPTKKRGKKYQIKRALVDKQTAYPLPEALSLLRQTAYAQFDATAELHFNLSINPQKTEQQVRTYVNLPHGTGKKRRILVFADPKQISKLKSSDIILGDDEMIEKIESGFLDFDLVLAHPSFMPKLAKVSRKLGPKGLMPNPKSGTVGEDVLHLLEGFTKGKVEIRNQADSTVLHACVGKLSFSDGQLRENILTLINTLISAKPAKAKEPFIRACFLKATMGPAIRIDLTSLS